MSAIGAKYRWREGKILHAARLWKAPTMRRIPRILIEDRAKEVGIKMYVDEPWMVFAETATPSENMDMKEAIELAFYQNRFHLLPGTIKSIDTYDWLKEDGNALVLFARENRYYILPVKRS